MKTIIVALAAAFVMHSAIGENFAVAGAGSYDGSCGDWLKYRRTNQDHLQDFIVSWVQGYMSGINMANELKINLPTASVMEAWLDKECAADPTRSVYVYATSLYLKVQADGHKLPK